LSEKGIDIEVSAAEIAEEMKQAAQESITEEDVKIRIEHILRIKVFDPLKIPVARYERTTVVSGLRSDALYGRVVLEYEPPNKFKTKSGFENAIEQTKKYIMEEAESSKLPVHRFFGVALDGLHMGFVRYSQRLKDWEVSEKPIEVNRYTVVKFLEAVRGLARKPLDADLLIKDLGPGSKVAKNAVNIFYRKIINAKTERAKMLFNDWRRVFSQVCAYSPQKIKGLEALYGIKEKNVDYEALLFAVHSYYALVMKILAAEAAVLFGGYFLKSYTRKLEGSYLKSPESLLFELKKLEEGGIFIELGIENFLEADYFAWYLDEWGDEVADSVIRTVKVLSEYEPATAELEPDVIRDLFKRLYQNLVPKKIRHDLGEYYTPDWLAELVLNEVGFTFENFEKMGKEHNAMTPLEMRLLDPACGSGTFLVLAIKRLKEYAREHFLEEKALGKIMKNVVGFDLNPLAVMASRANYLLALGELIREHTSPVELPVYFADSVLAEKRSTYAGAEYALKTTVGEFSVPVIVVEKGLLSTALSLIEECIRLDYSQSEFKNRLSRELQVINEGEVSMLVNLYAQILKLHKQNKNKIWTRVLKNSFAPLFMGKFDYVVGNPPWVNWESLPEDYRNASKGLWFSYGLFTLSGMEARLGGGKKDISALFTYVCTDRYLKDDGFFGFLITQAVFKTRGAGEGFRRFIVRNEPLQVVKVHDLVEIKPFEGANNRTATIFLRKGKQTKYPVPYIVWRKKHGGEIDPAWDLDETSKHISKIEMEAIPADSKKRNSPWLTAPKLDILQKVIGASRYQGFAGIYSGGLNAVYWLKLLQTLAEKEEKIEVLPHLYGFFRETFGVEIKEDKTKVKVKTILVENITEGVKKVVEKTQVGIEDFFVYPLIKSIHLKKWKLKDYIYTLQMQDPVKRMGYDEKWVKTHFPKTYGYLKRFESILLERAAYKKYFKKSDPFYSMFDVGKYTFAPYKIVWSQMGSRLVACVVSKVNDLHIGTKLVIPEHVLAFIPTKKEEEAHFICAVLNSSVANLILQSLARGTKSFGAPKFIKNHLGIPKFDQNNSVHIKLAKLSKKAHELAVQKNPNLAKVEQEIDNLVAEIYGLKDDELEKVKASLQLLEGKPN